jgi:hypothetical protein
MADLETSKAQLEKLKRARASGALEVWIGERRVRYRSDAELRAQIAALENYIASIEGTPTPHSVVIQAKKGW